MTKANSTTGPIRSMTGFARTETVLNGRKYIIEIRSVNHRFQETNLRLPFRDFETEINIRELIAGKVARGFVEMSLTANGMVPTKKRLVADEDLVQQFVEIVKKIKEKHHLAGEADLATLLSQKDVLRFEEEEPDTKNLRDALGEAVEEAMDRLVEMRTVEGEILRRDIMERIDSLEKFAEEVIAVKQSQSENVFQKTRQKIEKLLGSPIDPQRVLTEAAMLAERSDISEEVIRFKHHLEQVRSLMNAGGPVGRKVEFILQELNREANTISSKSTLYDINRLVVDMKSDIEKIREQAANIE